MKLTIAPDPSLWLVLPTLDEDVEPFVADALELLREVRGERFEEQRAALDAALRYALALRSADDAFTLQHWPGDGLLHTIVHVVAIDLEAREEPLSLVEGVGFVHPPTVLAFDSEHLGEGVEVAGLIDEDRGDGPVRRAQVGYSFAGSSAWIAVMTEPTHPAAITRTLHATREMVRTLSVEGGENAWGRAERDRLPDKIGDGDDWQLDEATRPEGKSE